MMDPSEKRRTEKLTEAVEATAENTAQIAENTDPALPVRPGERPTVSQANMETADQARREAKVLLTAGQRRVNLIWESSQALIALLVVFTTCLGIAITLIWDLAGATFPPEWWTIVGLVIGFYFGRTNHARVGDGAQP